jgi:hypothetical protein
LFSSGLWLRDIEPLGLDPGPQNGGGSWYLHNFFFFEFGVASLLQIQKFLTLYYTEIFKLTLIIIYTNFNVKSTLIVVLFFNISITLNSGLSHFWLIGFCLTHSLNISQITSVGAS